MNLGTFCVLRLIRILDAQITNQNRNDFKSQRFFRVAVPAEVRCDLVVGEICFDI